MPYGTFDDGSYFFDLSGQQDRLTGTEELRVLVEKAMRHKPTFRFKRWFQSTVLGRNYCPRCHRATAGAVCYTSMYAGYACCKQCGLERCV